MVDVTDGGTASGSFGSPDPPKIIRKRLAPGAPLGADAMSRAGQEPNAQQMLQSNLKKVGHQELMDPVEALLGTGAMSRASQEPNAQLMLQSNLKKVLQSEPKT